MCSIIKNLFTFKFFFNRKKIDNNELCNGDIKNNKNVSSISGNKGVKNISNNK